jgi:tetratricopeptide (TPR) repeat protein
VSLAQARLLVGIKRWNDAQGALSEVLADPDAGAEPWFLLAQCQLGLTQPRAARTSAGRGLALAPDNEWGHRILALAELSSGDKRAARRSADRAVAIAPGRPEPMYVLVQVLLAQGRKRQAERVAEGNLAANPSSRMARESAAAVALSRRNWPDAERHARAGLRIDPQSAGLMIQLGAALQAQNRRAEAADVYAAAARADPTDQRGRRALGRLGMTVAGGGGVIAVKLAIVWVASVNGRSWLFGSGGRRVPLFAAIVAAIMLIAFGYQELRQRQAIAQISPQLREVARRERRTARRSWLTAIAVAAAVLAVPALAGRHFVIGGCLLAVASAAAYLRFGWRSGITRADLRNRLTHSIRWRFR